MIFTYIFIDFYNIYLLIFNIFKAISFVHFWPAHFYIHIHIYICIHTHAHTKIGRYTHTHTCAHTSLPRVSASIWHSTDRGEFHLYANLKLRAHFYIPPCELVETCPVHNALPAVIALPGTGENAKRVSLAKRCRIENFCFVVKQWLSRCSLSSKYVDWI